MENIKEHVRKNRELYRDSPEISKYFEENPDCILCSQEIEKNNQKQDKTSSLKIYDTVKPKKAYPSSLKRFLMKLGILNSEIEPKIPVFKSNLKNNIKYVTTYLKFLEAVDLTDAKKSIKTFEENIFFEAFQLNILDENFSNFLKKLQADPIVYDKKDKIRFLYIIIFAFDFAKRMKIDTKKLKDRIVELSFLFVRKPEFIIDFQGDIVVDRFILQLRCNTGDLDEAIFMNKIYLSGKKDKEYFSLFHKRLIEGLTILDSGCTLSFLKHVFAHNTILFNCIQDIQLIKLILSFYQNMNKADATVEILTVLNDKLDDHEIGDVVSNELRSVVAGKKKYSKTQKLLQIHSVNSVIDLKNLIEEDRDSFDFMLLLFNTIRSIAEIVRDPKNSFDVLTVLMIFFQNLKSEFLDRFFTQILETCCNILERIKETEKNFEESFIVFNKDYWDVFSTMVLIAQRDGIENDRIKKKKCTEERDSTVLKAALKLIDAVYKIEEKASSSGINDFKKLKERAFKITSKDN